MEKQERKTLQEENMYEGVEFESGQQQCKKSGVYSTQPPPHTQNSLSYLYQDGTQA